MSAIYNEIMSPLEWLASQATPTARQASHGNDVVPRRWTAIGPGGKIIPIPKGNYKEVTNPEPGGTGTWYLLRPAPPTKWEFNPVQTTWWQPAKNGVILSPKIGDDRKGVIVNRRIGKDGTVPADGVVTKWMRSLPKDQLNAWFDEAERGEAGGGPRWAYVPGNGTVPGSAKKK